MMMIYDVDNVVVIVGNGGVGLQKTKLMSPSYFLIVIAFIGTLVSAKPTHH